MKYRLMDGDVCQFCLASAERIGRRSCDTGDNPLVLGSWVCLCVRIYRHSWLK